MGGSGGEKERRGKKPAAARAGVRKGGHKQAGLRSAQSEEAASGPAWPLGNPWVRSDVWA